MRIKEFAVVIGLCGVFLTACNNDIFLGIPDMPEYESVTIEGDGGEVSFDVSLKELQFFGFDVMSYEEQYYKYYNAAGEEIDRLSPASEISLIVYETDFTRLELLRRGSTFTVRSVCRASQWEGHWTLRFDYGYGPRFKDIAVVPGKPVEVVEVVYPDGLEMNDCAHVSTLREGYLNNGPLPQRLLVRPYLNELATVLVTSNNPSSWINGERFSMPVPVYTDGGWNTTVIDGIVPGTRLSYEGPDRLTEVYVEIPAFSHVNVFTDVIYSGAEGEGYMVFYNEALDRKIVEGFRATSRYPVWYQIRIENVE